MRKCKDCRHGCHDDDPCYCDDHPVEGLLSLQIVTGLSLICLFVFISYLVALTKIETGGIRYTPVEYFEKYNHCAINHDRTYS